ncbi:hypothetical protein [Streptomyces sp. NPDC002067]
MEWIHPDDPDGTRHAGRQLARLTDGTIPTYRTGQVLREREYDADGEWWRGPDRDRPAGPPAALVPDCLCGWRGTDVPYPHDDLPASEMAARTAAGRWHAHAAAALNPAVPGHYRTQAGQLAHHLTELADERPRAALNLARMLREIADHIEPLAIAEALTHRVRWDEIGADLRQTKQAVNRRYSRPSRELTARVQQLTGEDVETLLAAARDRRPGTPPPGHHQWPTVVAWILNTDDQP